jgi:hypothetical protein
MKKNFIVSILLCTCFCSAFAQSSYDDTVAVTSIEDAINIALKYAKKHIKNDNAIIFCIVENQIDMDSINPEKNVWLVNPVIPPCLVKKKNKTFFLEFLVRKEKDTWLIKVSICTAIKKSSKKLKLIYHHFDMPYVFRIIGSP